jgi:hypothetical protein
MVARPLAWPRMATTYFDLTERRQFVGMRAELGLSPLTTKFPSQASFRWVLARVPQAQWGFRSAARKYYELYPESFVKRVEREGVWHLWVTPEVTDPESFALVFDEQEPYLWDRVAFDDKYDGYSFTYSEPNTLWQHTSAFDAESHLQSAKFLEELKARAAQPAEVTTTYPLSTQPVPLSDALLAQVALNSYLGNEGEPSGYPLPSGGITVNCNGDPELPKPSRWSLWHDYEGQPALNDPRVDGAYIDSIGWSNFDAAENMRREQWATADIPLGVSFRSGGPTQMGAFTSYELYEAISEAMHERGKLVLANSFPYSHVFVAHLLDVLGAGEGGTLDAFHDAQRLGFCRALSYHKPLSHMNYAYFNPDVPLAEKERAMQRNLIYGVWPGSGNVNAPAQLDSVRPLYRKYMPIFARLAKAGWEPVTLAEISPEELLVERYGEAGSEGMVLVVHNPTAAAVEGTLTLDEGLTEGRSEGTARDLVGGERVLVRGGKAEVRLEAWQTMVLGLRMR